MTAPGSIANQVSSALSCGAVVLTSNERAARTLRLKLAQLLQSPQQILSLSAWAATEWQSRIASGEEEKVLLTAFQERRLWDEVVRSDHSLQTLLAHDSIAELAMSAAALLDRWNARHLLKLSPGSGDASVFQTWLQEIERLFSANRWISHERLPKALADSIRRVDIHGPRDFLLVGFDELLPAQLVLVDALRGTGARVEAASIGSIASYIRVASAETLTDELAMCARWARRAIENQRRVAIVHAHPEEIRTQLERALRLHVDSAANDIANPAASEKFEFSLGSPLSSLAFVRHAILLLKILSGPIDMQGASELLRSRYLFGSGTRLFRAEFDAQSLREDQRLRAEVNVHSLSTLLRSAKQGRPHWPQLHALADALTRASSLLGSRQHRGWESWTDVVRETMREAHFNQDGRETSFDFQVRRRWEELLDEMAQLQAIDREVTWDTALETLERMCAGTLFATESHDAPIQIMNPAEAAGSELDALWVLGATDSAWPAPASTHPLLPFALQKEAGMPGASWERSTERVAVTVQRLMRSAAEVIVSHARTTPTGEKARLSRLFEAYNLQNFELEYASVEEPAQLITQTNEPPLPPLPDVTLHGGARVLELQAACPFRAFAEARLFSAPPAETSDGMNAGARGVVLHQVLENFWLAVGSRKALANISVPDEVTGIVRRQALLAEIVDNALGRVGASEWEKQYIQLERSRITALANRWLDYELSRLEDFSIEEIEQEKRDVQIGPLHLNLRVDRVDRVRTVQGREGLVLIDYKTSPHRPGEWSGDRPDQPQLPLYAAVLDSDELLGIAFANVTPGERDFGIKGIGDDEDIFGTRNTVSLNDQLPAWQQTLEMLADQFASGYVAVEPKRPPATCAYCEQRVLCRIDSLRDLNTIPDDTESVE